MIQNLRYYCKQRIEALADKQCKFSCIYRVRFEHIIVQGANKISYDSLSNLKLLKWKNFISNKHTYFSTTWRKCLNSVNLWNCAGL